MPISADFEHIWPFVAGFRHDPCVRCGKPYGPNAGSCTVIIQPTGGPGIDPNAPTRLVLNRNSDLQVLHTEDCAAIRHQVEHHDRAPRQGQIVYEHLGSREDGASLYAESRGPEIVEQFNARYVTLEDLPSVGRYRRCRRCLPDAPEGPPPGNLISSKRVENLGVSDIGRESLAGQIVSVTHEADASTVVMADGAVLRFDHGDRLEFPRR